MSSSKRIGFFWGEEKITLLEFEKNSPQKIVSTPLGSRSDAPSPFSTKLTEEIQITTVLKKTLQENHITEGFFYVSLPMKEIILRSFSIPFVKPENLQTAIKFEVKKYIPFDIQDLSYAFHTIPYSEGANKRLQVVFFAARKDVWSKYERIFKQLNVTVAFCEPYIVSLAKSLLYRKEIKPSQHLAFLTLERNLGRICFIDKGIPQFIREFPIVSNTEETGEVLLESLNSRIVTEVVNSFDFYARQFNGDRIEEILVLSEFVQKDLIENLESELKVKITRFSPVISSGALGRESNDMDAIYAMGACVSSSIEPLSKFNFLGEAPEAKKDNEMIVFLKPFVGLIVTAFLCIIFLIGATFYFQKLLNDINVQYKRITTQEGQFAGEDQGTIQGDVQSNTDQLNQFKNIRTKSDITTVILKIASHLPPGALVAGLTISYGDQSDANNPHLSIDIKGDVYNDDPNMEIAAVNQIYTDLKNDKEFSAYVSNVVLDSFHPQDMNGRQVTEFNIHCS